MKETVSEPIEFTLPAALMGKKLNKQPVQKFVAILNDESRWAELLKELDK